MSKFGNNFQKRKFSGRVILGIFSQKGNFLFRKDLLNLEIISKKGNIL